jgi:hypothetical protein
LSENRHAGECLIPTRFEGYQQFINAFKVAGGSANSFCIDDGFIEIEFAEDFADLLLPIYCEPLQREQVCFASVGCEICKDILQRGAIADAYA